MHKVLGANTCTLRMQIHDQAVLGTTELQGRLFCLISAVRSFTQSLQRCNKMIAQQNTIDWLPSTASQSNGQDCAHRPHLHLRLPDTAQLIMDNCLQAAETMEKGVTSCERHFSSVTGVVI